MKKFLSLALSLVLTVLLANSVFAYDTQKTGNIGDLDFQIFVSGNTNNYSNSNTLFVATSQDEWGNPLYTLYKIEEGNWTALQQMRSENWATKITDTWSGYVYSNYAKAIGWDYNCNLYILEGTTLLKYVNGYNPGDAIWKASIPISLLKFDGNGVLIGYVSTYVNNENYYPQPTYPNYNNNNNNYNYNNGNYNNNNNYNNNSNYNNNYNNDYYDYVKYTSNKLTVYNNGDRDLVLHMSGSVLYDDDNDAIYSYVYDDDIKSVAVDDDYIYVISSSKYLFRYNRNSNSYSRDKETGYAKSSSSAIKVKSFNLNDNGFIESVETTSNSTYNLNRISFR